MHLPTILRAKVSNRMRKRLEYCLKVINKCGVSFLPLAVMFVINKIIKHKKCDSSLTVLLKKKKKKSFDA